MSKILYPAIVLFVLILCGWNIRYSNDIANAHWLIGTWQMKTARGNIYENWKRTNKYELSGKSYMLKEKDTVTFETMKLVQKGDSLFYIPTVKGQNQELPVRFAKKSITNGQLVFENLAHDFPQLISYRRIGQDSLVAEIAGKKNGKDRNELFPMRRIK